MKKTAAKDLTRLAEQAFRQSAQKVLDRAEQTGTPVIVWQNGAVMELLPHQLRRTSNGARKSRKKNQGA